MPNLPFDPDRRLLLTTMSGIAAMTAGIRPAVAQSWPTRPVTLMVPWPAGNPTDGLTRKLQPLFAKSLGQTVIVDNVAGAGGTLGVAKVLAQPADGHLVLMGTPTELILSPLTIPAVRYTAADFRMVGLFGRVPYMLVTRPDLPQTTLAEVVAMREISAAKPLSMGNIGPGSLIHIIGTQFAKVSRLTVTHVPYKGVPPMVQDLLASQLDMAFVPVNGSTINFVEQGKLRSMGITAGAPFPLFPQLKPMAAGDKLFEGFDFDVWGGMLVPRAVPAEVQQRLHQVFYDACRDVDFRDWARSTGTDLAPPMSLAELEIMYQRDTARYTALSKATPTTS
jgi:tripartite-type tricarboxylate transporter receptor subunit TctC